MSKALENVKAFCSDNKSGIFLALGIISGAVCVISACVATVKAGETIEEHNEKIENLENESEAETTDELAKEKRNLYLRTGFELVKEYSLPALMGVTSIFCILTSYKVLSAEKAALAASLTALSAEFAKYRQGVVDIYGAQADYDIYMGRKVTEKIEEVTDPKTGKKKKVKKYEETFDPCGPSPYSREWSGLTSHSWSMNPKRNLVTLKQNKHTLQTMLDANCVTFEDIQKVFEIDSTVSKGAIYRFVPHGIGLVAKRIMDELPDEWDWKGRHYFKADYDTEIDFGIDIDRLAVTNYSIEHGCNDDPYMLHFNCYPIDDILEYADWYFRKSKKDALIVDRAVLAVYDHNHNMSI